MLLERIGAVGRRLGTRTFLVGGPVRDLLLRHESPDLDIAVEARPAEFGRCVADELNGHFVFHRRFLTGTIHLPDGRHLDITQTRRETYPKPAMLPLVSPAPVEQDLGRRDFSINAIALELTPGAFGRFLDPHQGRRDIARRCIRVLHDRSFTDDPTRIFRCIRFAVRLGFDIEPRTLALLRAAIAEGVPARLSPERVLYELRLVCAEPKVLAIAEAVVREDVLRSVWAWQAPSGFFSRLSRIARADAAVLFQFWLSTLPITERFPVTRVERDSAVCLARFSSLRRLLARARRPSSVFGLLQPTPEPALRVLACIEPSAIARRIREYLTRYRHTRPLVTGKELRALGISPGPVYRRILNHLLVARLDGRIQTMSDELVLCRRLARRFGRS